MATFGSRLTRLWARGGAPVALLWPLSLLFRLVVALRRAAYRAGLLPSAGVDVPVVVIGNLVVGGSGKTPLVLWIARTLAARGWRPGIVSRGHRGTSAQPRAVRADSDPAECGDEPVLLARRSGTPVWIGRDRLATCRALRAADTACDVILSDDGLQHYRLARALEIAVVDRRGLGNGQMLPAGPLREPASRLDDVDAVVAHDCTERVGFAMRLVGTSAVSLGPDHHQRPLAGFAGGAVHAVAGIGEPARFFDHLRAQGLTVREHPFEDHHPFQPADLVFGDALPILMTEKDAVKCERFAPPGCWSVPVDAVLEPAFEDWLITTLEGLRRELGRSETA